MANPDQKTILIDNAFEEIKNICIKYLFYSSRLFNNLNNMLLFDGYES